jgi:hypothetical protein
MYVPEWEILADVLTRVLATGLEPERAKGQICSAIDDRKIGIRVKVDETDHDIPGKIRTGGKQVEPPLPLDPKDLDWVLSRPKDAWDTGPSQVESYLAGWEWHPRRITLLWLQTADVIDIFCSATGTGASAASKGGIDTQAATASEMQRIIKPIAGLSSDRPQVAPSEGPSPHRIEGPETYVEALLRRYGAIKEVWLIGSRAAGSANPSSDWDYIAFADRKCAPGPFWG